MLKNYFKLAWRNIARHPFYASVNILGLFAGILFFLLIGVYVWIELQVNRQLNHAERQYFLQSEWKGVDVNYAVTTLGPVAKRLKEEYPSLVANYYRWDGITSGVTKGDKSFREGIQLGDSTLLSMYGFELLHGNAATALQAPFSVVITEETAVKYFGRKDVVGETLTIQSFAGGKNDFSVTGVLKPVSKNSVTNLNENNNNTLFIPANTYTYFGRMSMDDWSNTWVPSYIELKEGVDVASVNKAISQLIQINAPPSIKENLQIKPLPLSVYYINQNNALVKRMLVTLSLTALFILLMAVVNFINIAISSAGGRMKEIGIRKVLGGIKKQLVVQFLSESLILVCLSTLMAIAVFPFAMPLFAGITGKEIPSLLSLPLYFLLVPVVLILLIGLLAGIYPAFVLSSVNTISSLKGKLKTVKENIWLRKSLVSFQFAIALLVLVAAAVVTQQVTHFFSNSLGYNKEYIVSSQVPRDWSREGVQKMATIRNEMATLPQVKQVSLSYEIPNGNNGNEPQVYKMGADSTTSIGMNALVTDEHYLNTYQIPLDKGAFFDDRRLDSGKVVINQKAVTMLGYKDAAEAIGQKLRVFNDPTIFTIKGVVSDFHFNTMQEAIKPIIFFNVYNAPVYRYLSFKVQPGNVQQTIEAIQKKWAVLMPGSSFEYTFMDDTLKKMYSTELQLKNAAYTATALSIVIVLLGVLGLVSLSIHKRVKEIGIRKVLGASLPGIILLFVKEFAWIIITAAAVACPVAFWMMSSWLNNYASHINISFIPFGIAIGMLALITVMLIGLQALKAAVVNPVKSLRTE